MNFLFKALLLTGLVGSVSAEYCPGGNCAARRSQHYYDQTPNSHSQNQNFQRPQNHNFQGPQGQNIQRPQNNNIQRPQNDNFQRSQNNSFQRDQEAHNFQKTQTRDFDRTQNRPNLNNDPSRPLDQSNQRTPNLNPIALNELEPQNKVQSDAEIKTRVEKAIADDNFLSPTAKKIQVTVKNGIVTLTGNVQSKNEKEKVLIIVRHLPGIKTANDNLQVTK